MARKTIVLVSLPYLVRAFFDENMNYQPAHILTLLAAVWLTLLPAIIPAQQPCQHRYTTANGLLFGEAFASLTRNGEAWITYSNGEYLTRFDGVNWTHYHLPSLQLPTYVFYWGEDEHGIWFVRSSTNESWFVCRTPDGQWKKFHKSEGFFPYCDPAGGSPAWMDKQFYSHRYDPAVDSFTREKTPVYVPSRTDGEFASIGQLYNGDVYINFNTPGSTLPLVRYGDGFKKSIQVPGRPYNMYFSVGGSLAGAVMQNDEICWYTEGTCKPILPELPSGGVGKPVSWIWIKYANAPSHTYSAGLIVQTQDKKSWYLYELDSLGSARHLFGPQAGDFPRGYVWKDKLQNWWYSLSNGIVRLDENLLTFDETNPDMVNGLHAIGEDVQGNIWMGGYNGIGGFAVFDGRELHRRIFTNVQMAVMPGTVRSSSGTLYFLSEYQGGLFALRDGSLEAVKVPAGMDNLIGFYACQLQDGKIGLGLLDKGLGLATETNGLISQVKLVGKPKGMLLDNVLTITEDRGGRLWLGRISQGVALYDPALDTAVTWLRSPDVPGSLGALSSCLDDEGTLWLGTSRGLFHLSEPDHFDYKSGNLFDSLRQIHLPGNDTSTVHFLKNIPQYLVAGTQQAVYLLDKKYRDERPRIFALHFGEDIPGSSAEQNAVLYDSKGNLWVGTQEGAIRIGLKNLQFDTSATTLQLAYFRAADEEIALAGGQPWRLPMKKRSIKFGFTPSGNPFLRDDLFYDIVVVRHNGDTLFQHRNTPEKTAEIAYLPYGEYTLHVAAYKHNVLSGQATWQFQVPKLLSESPWFWSLAAALLVGVPFFFFYQKKRHQVELEKSRRERDGLKIQALSNFFNPHFINNSLNYVQTKSLADPETVDVVDGLSQNVRILYRNTQNSRGVHSLVQELILVENYLRIQQKRFGASLTFDLPPHETWDDYREVVVPVLLLQIHVENAVEKGVRGTLTGNGHVSLRIVSRTDGWQLVIEDNGRGRPVEYLRTQGHRKGSTTVMDNLIALMNQYNSHRLTIHYEDSVFENERMEKHGTRVVIFIPKNYNYEFS